MRTALTIGALAVAVLALAGCSAGTVQNTAATSSTSSPAPTTSTPARTHEVMYSFNVQGPGGPVYSPITYVDDNGSTVTEPDGSWRMLKIVHLQEGKIAMIQLGSAEGATSSYCSISVDGHTAATQTSYDSKNPASCAYIVQ